MSKEAKSAQKKIDSLPDSYYDGILPALEDASKSYEELSDEDKDQVKNNAVDSLYEQYYKSIADEINQKTNDFQISGYIDDGKYAECLNDITPKKLQKMINEMIVWDKRYVVYKTKMK